MPVFLSRSAPLGLALAAALVLAPAAASAEPAAPPPPSLGLTRESAEEFVDQRVPELLERHGAPGVVVSVVGDGAPLASAAHGTADLSTGTPLDPEVHGIPTASVAKSFTAVAVLQLAERGDVDLHEDVNTYLPEDLRVPDTHEGQPVTLHHLLTHSPGFDERTEMDDPEDAGSQRGLTEFLRDNTPDRVFPPGRFTAYSNYGTGLAGFVVQEVSGVPFEEYVERNVFAPLGMDGTRFGQLHEETDLVTGHRPDGSPVPYPHIPLVPAGAAVTTDDDMARFMLALLGGGELDGERVLGPDWTGAMLDRQLEVHPDTTAMGYGTYEHRRGTPRTVGHGGDLDGLHTGYLVVPEIDAGVFVAVNGDDAGPDAGDNPFHDLRFAVLNAFADTFAPAGDDGTGGERTDAADTGAYTGSYVTTRRSTSGSARIVTLFDNVTVRDAGDGSLRVRGAIMPEEHWLPVGNDVFETADGGERLAFVVEDGRAVAVYLEANPTSGYDRVPVWGSAGVHLGAVAVSLLLLLSGAVQLRRPGGAVRTAAAVSAGLTALACLTGVGLVVYAVTDLNRLQEWLLSGSAALSLPLGLAVPLTLVTAGFAVTAWVRGWWGPVRRVHYSLLPVAALAVVAVGAQYGLVWPFA
ncbi:serine hydrolase domain-containing protein [Nocardiopsis prasina]|uniref:serine hydrolase domain-containing protein n=1 Tax=Nocardiopsis prasina TaxID=2015 RepID=UPI00034989DB|nr:serine hydrolase domain-containing protein [Nocardiopsis prasina]